MINNSMSKKISDPEMKGKRELKNRTFAKIPKIHLKNIHSNDIIQSNIKIENININNNN